jgi:hypothetical protein
MKTPKLHLETGHPVTADAKIIAGDRFRFVDDQGRTVFEVICGNGSIEVRAVEFHTIGDNIHTGLISIKPKCANSIEIATQFYSKKQ